MTQRSSRIFMLDRSWCIGLAVVGLLGGAFMISAVMRDPNAAVLCRIGSAMKAVTWDISSTDLQLNAIRHYATSKIVPQQSFDEVTVTYDVLRSVGPCNFLVFGLGHDSLMWASLNAGGTTVFLEEDSEWVKKVLQNAPYLKAHHVKYRTQLSEADELIKVSKTEPACFAKNAVLRGNNAKRCKLALDMLPDEVYDKQWDLIMIDAPRGYFPEAPGRMAAIFSAAVMARDRNGSGVTHVFLHDVDRKVEKTYATMFLCKKNLVKGVGRLWHFEIPPSVKMGDDFC